MRPLIGQQFSTPLHETGDRQDDGLCIRVSPVRITGLTLPSKPNEVPVVPSGYLPYNSLDMTSVPSTPPEHAPPRPGWLRLPQMRYPNEYVWFLLFSSMDIMLTWVILSLGGSEVNPIAAAVIDGWGLPGAICFKFSLILMVILICEIISRGKHRVGRNLAQLAVVVSAIPVVYSMSLLAWHIAYEVGQG